MKKIVLVLSIICLLAINGVACSVRAPSTAVPTPSANTGPANTNAGSSNPKTNPTAVATPMSRPQAGKSQELTFSLKASADTYSLVMFLEQGETLDIDWKFVSSPQAGINFMFTTPEGREMDSKLQPLNLPGHPLYDQGAPSQKVEALVGSHVVINVGETRYCIGGYYTLVFTGNSAQSGIVYLRYSLAKTSVE